MFEPVRTALGAPELHIGLLRGLIAAFLAKFAKVIAIGALALGGGAFSR